MDWLISGASLAVGFLLAQAGAEWEMHRKRTEARMAALAAKTARRHAELRLAVERQLWFTNILLALRRQGISGDPTGATFSDIHGGSLFRAALLAGEYPKLKVAIDAHRALGSQLWSLAPGTAEEVDALTKSIGELEFAINREMVELGIIG